MLAAMHARISLFIGGLIAKYLSAFLPGFLPENFSLNLWSGEIELKQVAVSRAAMSFLEGLMPWSFESLTIGRVYLRIHLFNLLETPIHVEVEDAQCVLSTEDFAMKRHLDKPTEPFVPYLQYIYPPPVPIDPTTITSTLLRVVYTIVDNAEVGIARIHVVLRDEISEPRHPHELAVFIKEASLDSSDCAGSPMWSMPAYRPTMYFALRLSHLHITLGAPRAATWASVLGGVAETSPGKLCDHCGTVVIVIGLRFGSPSDHADVGLSGAPAPFLTTGVEFRELDTHIADEQMAYLWDLLGRVFWWSRLCQVAWLRPSAPIKGNAKQWWQFGATVISEEMRARLAMLRCTTWSIVIAAAQRRRKYIRLYRKFLAKKPLTVDECIDLQNLDMGLDIDCVVAFRAIATRQLSKKKVPTLLQRVKKMASRWSGRNSLPSGSSDSSSLRAPLLSRSASTQEISDDDEEEFMQPHQGMVLVPSPASRQNVPTVTIVADGSDEGSMNFSVRFGGWRITLVNNARELAPERTMLDVRLVGASVSFDINAMFTYMSARVEIREIETSAEANCLRICCMRDAAVSPALVADWSMTFTVQCTHMHTGARLAESYIFLPGCFVNRLFDWLSPVGYVQAPVQLFYLVPPTLFADEIRNAQEMSTEKNLIPPFRMSIDAVIGPLTVVANTGVPVGPTVHVRIGKLIAICAIANADEVDQARFPEFQRSAVGPCGESAYDFLYASFEGLTVSYAEGAAGGAAGTPRETILRDVVKLLVNTAIAGISPSSASNYIPYGSAGVIELGALMLTMGHDAPWLLGDIGIPSIKISISNRFYQVLFKLLDSFMAPESVPPPAPPAADVEAAVAAIAANPNTHAARDLLEDDAVLQVDTMADYRGTRVVLRAPSIELVLIDEFPDADASVLRVRVMALRLHCHVRPDSHVKTTARVQTEAWYMSHVVRAWEPLIEPWSLTIAHHYDALAQDVEIKGDVRPLNLTVSTALVQTLVRMGHTFAVLPGKKVEYHTSNNAILNDTGVSFRVSGGNLASDISVAPGEEMGVSTQQQPTFTIELSNGIVLRKVALRHGCQVTNKSASATVTTIKGFTCIHVHTTMLLVNRTDEQLDLVVEATSGSSYFHSIVVDPGAKAYVPIQVLQQGHIMVRLRGRGVGFGSTIDISSKSSSSPFDIVMKPEKGASSEATPALRMIGHQHTERHITTITVAPVIVIENLLYTKCDIKLSDANGEVPVIHIKDVPCGKRIECFMNTSNVALSICIPGCAFTIPITLNDEKSSLARRFRGSEPDHTTIGVPFNDSDTSCVNYIAIETDYSSGECPHVVIYAPFWFVNHTVLPMFVREAAGDEDHRRNVVPTYPRMSIHGAPMLMGGCVATSNASIRLAFGESDFSEAVSIGKLETGISTTISNEKTGNFHVRLKIHRAQGRFHRSKIMSALPQLIIVNSLSERIFLRQNSDTTFREVAANSRITDFSWSAPERPQVLRIAYDSARCDGWSGIISPCVLGEQQISMTTRLENGEPGPDSIIECVVKQRENIVYAVFHAGDIRFPPCKIVNNSRFSIEISQTDQMTWKSILPFSSTPFCWIEPLSVLAIDVRIEGTGSSDAAMRTFPMDSDDDAMEVWTSTRGSLVVSVRRDEGPTKLLTLNEVPPNASPGDDVPIDVHMALVEKQISTVESAIKYAESRFEKEIEATMALKTRPSKVFIKVVEGWDFPATDANGLTDPYIEIIAGDYVDKTAMLRDELNPRFHHESIVQVRDGNTSIFIRVTDQNLLKNEVIGGFLVDITTLGDEKTVDQWFPIFKIKQKEVTSERQYGQVRLILQWVRSSETMKQRLHKELESQRAHYNRHLMALRGQQERMKVLMDQLSCPTSKIPIPSTIEGVNRLLNRRSKVGRLPTVTRRMREKILSGKFKVTVISAQKTLDMDSGSSSDPYCKVEYGEQTFTTKTHKKTLNPEWNETFEFDYIAQEFGSGCVLRVVVFDQDNASEDDFMGEYLLAVNELIDLPVHQYSQEWHSLISLNVSADSLLRGELGESTITRGDILIGFEWVVKSTDVYPFDLALAVSLPWIGLSLVDSEERRELFYLSIRELHLEYEARDHWMSYSASVSVGNIQIDNPDLDTGGGDTAHMVVFDSMRNANDGPLPIIGFVVVSEHVSNVFDYFPFVSLLIQGISLSISTNWLSRLLWLVQYILDNLFEGYEEPLPSPLPVLEIPHVGQDSGRKVLFKRMILSPISLAITFRNSIDQLTVQRRTDYDWILKFVSRYSLENAPVRLNALLVNNHFCEYDDLTYLVIMHYCKNGVSAVMSVLGSTELLGNPTQIVSGVGSGVKDLFFEPAAGFKHGPGAFTRGVAKGVASLLSGTVGGGLNFASKVTGNLGKVTAALTMDDEYQAQIKRQQLLLSNSDATGMSALKTGGKAFGKGLIGGVTGIFSDPFKGAKRDGVKGFVKGIGKGLLGVVAKPITGTIQLASAAAGGVRNAASSHSSAGHRRSMLARFPRHFHGIQGRIKLYSSVMAKGAFFHGFVPPPKYRADTFVALIDLPDSRALLLSNKQILMVTMDAREAVEHNLVLKDDWLMPLDQLQVELSSDSSKITLRSPKNAWDVDVSQVEPVQLQRFVEDINKERANLLSDGTGLGTDDTSGDSPWPVSPIADVTPNISGQPSKSEQEVLLEQDEIGLAHCVEDIEHLQTDLDRLKTDISAAMQVGTALEVTVHRATHLTTKHKLKAYCKVWLEVNPAMEAINATQSVGKGKKKFERHPSSLKKDVFESIISEDPEPMWEHTCKFPIENVDSMQLVIKVLGERIGVDRSVGKTTIVNLGNLTLNQMEMMEVPMLKEDKPHAKCGLLHLSLRLFNSHLVKMSAQVDITKHKLIATQRQRVTLEKRVSLRESERATNRTSSRAETESRANSSDGASSLSQTQFSDDDDDDDSGTELLETNEELELEDALRRQFINLTDEVFLREASLRDLNAKVQIEVIRARNFVLAARKRTAPPMYLILNIGRDKFKSTPIKSWEPEWRMRFTIKMPRLSSIPVEMRVRRKQFLGARTVGKLSIEFNNLVKVASTPEGTWLTFHDSRGDETCELHVRIQIMSVVLDGLIDTEAAVASELKRSAPTITIPQ